MKTLMSRNRKLNREIGAALRALRRRHSFSDAELAESMGYGRQGKANVNRWERGEVGMSAARLVLYLRAIGASFDELDCELDRKPPKSGGRLAEIARKIEELGRRARD